MTECVEHALLTYAYFTELDGGVQLSNEYEAEFQGLGAELYMQPTRADPPHIPSIADDCIAITKLFKNFTDFGSRRNAQSSKRIQEGPPTSSMAYFVLVSCAAIAAPDTSIFRSRGQFVVHPDEDFLSFEFPLDDRSGAGEHSKTAAVVSARAATTDRTVFRSDFMKQLSRSLDPRTLTPAMAMQILIK